MLVKILVAVGLVLSGLAVVVATRPAAFRVARSITIDAPPEVPFALVNDFHEWPVWSPYEKLDPAVTRTFEGPRSGTGAVYAYSGNDKVGTGRITLEKSAAPSSIALRLDFIKPFTVTNRGSFTFEPQGPGTKVTWAMEGRNNFVFKAFSLLMDMDKLVGTEFERGLAAMKSAAEQRTASNGHVAAVVH
ncbi:MAG TPA: SRPBCC family protein [Polyangiaceae bacterium]